MGRLVLQGKMTTEEALKRLGVRRQAEVQKRISDRIDPELAPATIEKKTVDGKAGDVPLIDSGQLRTGITHQVKIEGRLGDPE